MQGTNNIKKIHGLGLPFSYLHVLENLGFTSQWYEQKATFKKYHSVVTLKSHCLSKLSQIDHSTFKHISTEHGHLNAYAIKVLEKYMALVLMINKQKAVWKQHPKKHPPAHENYKVF